MAFYVGQKVVCISQFKMRDSNGLPQPPQAFPSIPAVGDVYTVRESGEYILLEEIVNPCWTFREGKLEGRFWSRRFRPLVTKPTDISIFTSLLTPSPERTKELCD